MRAAIGLAVAHAAEANAGNLEAGMAEADGLYGLHDCQCASLFIDARSQALRPFDRESLDHFVGAQRHRSGHDHADARGSAAHVLGRARQHLSPECAL